MDRVRRPAMGPAPVADATGGAEACQGRATARPIEAAATVPGPGRTCLGLGRLAKVPGKGPAPAAVIPMAEGVGRTAITDVPHGPTGATVAGPASARRVERSSIPLAAAVTTPGDAAASRRVEARVAPAAMGAPHGAGAAA